MSYFPGYGPGPYGGFSGYGGYGGAYGSAYAAGFPGYGGHWGNPAASFSGFNPYGAAPYGGVPYGGAPYGGYPLGGSVALPTEERSYQEVPFNRQVTELQPMTYNVPDSYTVENIQYNVPRTHLEPTLQMVPAMGVEPRTYLDQFNKQVIHPPYSPVSMMNKSGILPPQQSVAHSPLGPVPLGANPYGPYAGGPYAGPYGPGSFAGGPQQPQSQAGLKQSSKQGFPQQKSFAPVNGGNPLFGQSQAQGIKSTRDNYDSLQ